MPWFDLVGRGKILGTIGGLLHKPIAAFRMDGGPHGEGLYGKQLVALAHQLDHLQHIQRQPVIVRQDAAFYFKHTDAQIAAGAGVGFSSAIFGDRFGVGVKFEGIEGGDVLCVLGL